MLAAMALIPNAVKTLKGKQFKGGGDRNGGKYSTTMSYFPWIFKTYLEISLHHFCVLSPYKIRDKWVRRNKPIFIGEM